MPLAVSPLHLHLSHAADARDGGISTAVAQLILNQQINGLNSAWCTASRFSALHRDSCLRAEICSLNPSLIHIHGLWRSPTRIANGLSHAGFPLVISPHGMLDSGAMAFSPRKKQLVWRLWERSALHSANCLHALCPAEALSIRKMLPNSLIAVIPNGVALPIPKSSSSELRPSSYWSSIVPEGERVLLFLGRFHSKKGISALLKAWQSVVSDAERAGWWLAFVGYGDGGSLLRQVSHAQARSEMQRVIVKGPVFGDEKSSVLTDSSAFVLASFSEGLPMAALEAMAHQLPCLLSTACNLPDAFAAGAALPAEPVVDSLSTSLRELFALSDSERSSLGESGRDHVADHYSWSSVAQKTRELYEWILSSDDRPQFVEPP